ncbi:Gp138 family membrane-puncturing spike protein [bacterium]|nr:Gp138 family membrane-puncturing spike protein [bacterium]
MGMESGLVDALNGLIDTRLKSVYTMLPAKVTSVDYTKNNLSAQPLITGKFADGSQLKTPELHQVPIFVLSAGGGSTRITLPVKVGDTVLILFSQRSVGVFLGSNASEPVDSPTTTTHGINPIMALPCLFTPSTAKEISSDDLVVENGSSKITVSPSGDIAVKCPKLTIEGDLEVNGDVATVGTLTNNGITVGSNHGHTHGDPAGSTSVPIPITP